MEHDKYYGDLNLHQFRHLLHIIIKPSLPSSATRCFINC